MRKCLQLTVDRGSNPRGGIRLKFLTILLIHMNPSLKEVYKKLESVGLLNKHKDIRTIYNIHDSIYEIIEMEGVMKKVVREKLKKLNYDYDGIDFVFVYTKNLRGIKKELKIPIPIKLDTVSFPIGKSGYLNIRIDENTWDVDDDDATDEEFAKEFELLEKIMNECGYKK